MCIHLKIYIIIFDTICVFLLEHFDFFFKCFYCCLRFLIWFFAKTQNFHFYVQIKKKTGNKFHPPPSSQNNKSIWKLFKLNIYKAKGQLSFVV